MAKASSHGTRSFGFTLIELMIVVAIIAVLASIAIPKFANLLRKSQEGSTKGNLGNIRSVLSIYYADMEGQYPADINSFTINGKYMNAFPTQYLPYYHPSSNAIGLYEAGFPWPWTTDVGSAWIYIPATSFPFTGISTLPGGVFIGCTHTDSTGTPWTAY